ncbi:hypothetical protein BDV96DRAFT_372506 [Lophiotrema nucula]|uniref:Secreted protein n=1 Tax=Lophiotrema nucula TaxID=690887 RepID=A0A6A5ZIS3_9PLEO|nr:hypothetical protein BDV96DRAFT_372506 [Lophiotrema nucula]
MLCIAALLTLTTRSTKCITRTVWLSDSIVGASNSRVAAVTAHRSYVHVTLCPRCASTFSWLAWCKAVPRCYNVSGASAGLQIDLLLRSRYLRFSHALFRAGRELQPHHVVSIPASCRKESESAREKSLIPSIVNELPVEVEPSGGTLDHPAARAVSRHLDQRDRDARLTNSDRIMAELQGLQSARVIASQF